MFAATQTVAGQNCEEVRASFGFHQFLVPPGFAPWLSGSRDCTRTQTCQELRLRRSKMRLQIKIELKSEGKELPNEMK